MPFEWLEKHRQSSRDISVTQGEATPMSEVRDERTDTEKRLEEYLDMKRREAGRFDEEKAIQDFNEEEAEIALEQESKADDKLAKILSIFGESIISRVWGMLMGRLIPSGAEDGKVVGYEGGLKWVPGAPSTIGKTVGMNLRIKVVEDEVDDAELEWDFDKWSDDAP